MNFLVVTETLRNLQALVAMQPAGACARRTTSGLDPTIALSSGKLTPFLRRCTVIGTLTHSSMETRETDQGIIVLPGTPLHHFSEAEFPGPWAGYSQRAWCGAQRLSRANGNQPGRNHTLSELVDVLANVLSGQPWQRVSNGPRKGRSPWRFKISAGQYYRADPSILVVQTQR